jgi:hypothetical protein
LKIICSSDNLFLCKACFEQGVITISSSSVEGNEETLPSGRGGEAELWLVRQLAQGLLANSQTLPPVASPTYHCPVCPSPQCGSRAASESVFWLGLQEMWMSAVWFAEAQKQYQVFCSRYVLSVLLPLSAFGTFSI